MMWLMVHSSACVCCVFFPFILDIKFVGRTSRSHTGFLVHLPLLSAVRALVFLARRITPLFLSLVDREVEFCVVAVVCCFSHSAHWLPTRKNYFTRWPIPLVVCWTGGGGKVWQRPPPKKKITRRIHMSRRYASRRSAGGLGPSRIRTRIPTTRQLGQWVSLRKTLRFRVRLQLSQSRCLSRLLAMSGRVSLFLPPRGHEPPPTPRDRLDPNLRLYRHRFSIPPVMPNARMSLCTQSCTNDLIVLHPLGIFFYFFFFLVRKIPFDGIELTSQRVGRLHGYLWATGATGFMQQCFASNKRWYWWHHP